MDRILGGLKHMCAISYIDDIIVFSDSEEEHLKHLDLVFKALIKFGAKINPEKCKFFVKSTIFLGYQLSTDGIKPDPAKMNKLKEWKIPKTEKKLREFLGFCNYYHHLVKNYAVHSQSLNALLNKGNVLNIKIICFNLFSCFYFLESSCRVG